MDWQTLSTIVGTIVGLLTLIGGVVGFIWWMSSMHAETKASRVANETGVKVLDEKLSLINNTIHDSLNEVKGTVRDHGTRIGAIEIDVAVLKAKDDDTELQEPRR